MATRISANLSTGCCIPSSGAHRLDPRRFTRVHHTHIVHLDQVIAFRRHGKGGMTAELRDRTQLAVSRAKAQELRKLGV